MKEKGTKVRECERVKNKKKLEMKEKNKRNWEGKRK